MVLFIEFQGTGGGGGGSGRDHVGIVEGSCKYRARGSVFGENSFYRETWDTRLGGCHVSKRSFEPRIANPEVRIQVRDLVRVVSIVAFFAPLGVNTRGEFVLPSPI